MFYSGGKAGDGCVCNIKLSEQRVRARSLEILIIWHLPNWTVVPTTPKLLPSDAPGAVMKTKLIVDSPGLAK